MLINPRAQLTTSHNFKDDDSDHWFNVSSIDMYTDRSENAAVNIRSNTDYELSIAIHSIKCFDMQDTNEKLRLTCGVTAAHCH